MRKRITGDEESAQQPLVTRKEAGTGKKTSFLRNTICLAVVLALIIAAPVPAQPAKKKAGSDAAMLLHHMHTMLDHGLIMVMQGSNLVMFSSMRMAPGVDEITMAHGYEMIADGKAMIRETLSGSHMKRMHEQGYWNDAVMAYTHELGAEVLAVVDDVEKMDMTDMSSPEAMKMHHMHIVLNHALEMAAEGANLVMLGKMKMAGGVDEHSVTHGRKMIADARKLWDEVMGGQAMKEMHAAGSTPEASEQMSHTHKLAKHGERVLALLEKMDSLKY